MHAVLKEAVERYDYIPRKRSWLSHVRGTGPEGRITKRDGLFLLPRTRLKGPFAEALGCELETGPLGSFYKTDAMKETTVKGVFACGDVATPMPAIAFAVADGVRAGNGAHQSLIFRP